MADNDDRGPVKTDDEASLKDDSSKETSGEETSGKGSSKTSRGSSKGPPSKDKDRTAKARARQDDEDEDEDEDEDLDDEDDEDDEPPPRKASKSSKASARAPAKSSKKAPPPSKKAPGKVIVKRIAPKPVSYYLPFSLLGMALVGAHVFWDVQFAPVAVLGIAITIWSYMGIGSANEVV